MTEYHPKRSKVLMESFVFFFLFSLNFQGLGRRSHSDHGFFMGFTWFYYVCGRGNYCERDFPRKFTQKASWQNAAVRCSLLCFWMNTFTNESSIPCVFLMKSHLPDDNHAYA